MVDCCCMTMAASLLTYLHKRLIGVNINCRMSVLLSLGMKLTYYRTLRNVQCRGHASKQRVFTEVVRDSPYSTGQF